VGLKGVKPGLPRRDSGIGSDRWRTTHTRSSIAAEVQRLAADPDDRTEMRTVREQLAELAPERAD